MPAIKAEDLEVLGPYVPLCQHLGRLAMALAEGSSVDRIDVELLGRIADRDTRPLATATLLGVLAGKTEEDVNAVNAPAVAEERGIEIVETKSASARDFENLVRITVHSGDKAERVVGTTFGRRNRPHLLEAWGQRFDVQLDEHLAVFRYGDRPGIVGLHRHRVRRGRRQHRLGRRRPSGETAPTARPSWCSPPTRPSRARSSTRWSRPTASPAAARSRCDRSRGAPGSRGGSDAIIYQVYPRSFQDSDGDGEGDLAGITARLGHIASLGADAVWLSPIYPSPMADGGYDVADYAGRRARSSGRSPTSTRWSPRPIASG